MTDAKVDDRTERLVAVVKAGGLSHLVRQAFRKLSPPWLAFGTVTFFVRGLSDEPPEGTAFRDVQLRWAWASPSDINLLIGGRDDAPSEDALRERFARGDRCAVAIGADGRLAHSRWITTERGYIPELDVDVVLAPGEAYHYDAYTRPDVRGCGIDGAVRSFIFRTLRDAGLEKVCWYVRGDNPIAMRVSRRWGEPSGKLRYVRFCGSRPVVLGLRALERVTLISREGVVRKQEERDLRARAWREWFESWLNMPLAKRSRGYDAVSEEHFISTAEHIASTLELDPGSDFVLDVGCDSAMVSRFVAPRCRGFVGLDLISAMLTDIDREDIRSASGRRAWFMAADGRALPFQSDVFSKAYCSGVIHTLPSHEDALRFVRELVRVCWPGGKVLIAGVPDVRKRFRARLEALREAGGADKMRLAIRLLIPSPIRSVLRWALQRRPRSPLVFLEFNLRKLKRKLEKEGLRCDILDFPEDYWSRDFRKARSNFIIRIPGSSHRTGVAKVSMAEAHLDVR